MVDIDYRHVFCSKFNDYWSYLACYHPIVRVLVYALLIVLILCLIKWLIRR
jgi:hypothetical protein